MPLYTYRCNECSKETDLLMGMNQEGQNFECSYCKSKQLGRVYKTFRIAGISKDSSSSSSSSCSSCSGGDCSSCSG